MGGIIKGNVNSKV